MAVSSIAPPLMSTELDWRVWPLATVNPALAVMRPPVVKVPDVVTEVNAPEDLVVEPIGVPSIAPPLMSTELDWRVWPLATVNPALAVMRPPVVKVPDVVTEVNAPVDVAVEPIGVPSIAPPLISTLDKTTEPVPLGVIVISAFVLVEEELIAFKYTSFTSISLPFPAVNVASSPVEFVSTNLNLVSFQTIALFTSLFWIINPDVVDAALLVLSLDKTIKLSFTVRFVVSTVVVFPFTVKLPLIVVSPSTVRSFLYVLSPWTLIPFCATWKDSEPNVFAPSFVYPIPNLVSPPNTTFWKELNCVTPSKLKIPSERELLWTL